MCQAEWSKGRTAPEAGTQMPGRQAGQARSKEQQAFWRCVYCTVAAVSGSPNLSWSALQTVSIGRQQAKACITPLASGTSSRKNWTATVAYAAHTVHALACGWAGAD